MVVSMILALLRVQFHGDTTCHGLVYHDLFTKLYSPALQDALNLRTEDKDSAFTLAFLLFL